MRQIPVGRTRFALVSDEDFEFLSRFGWHIHQIRDRIYAGTWIARNRRIDMHRLIFFGADHVDHWNGDGLDNQRSNLRPCSNMQNRWNCGPTKRNKSGVKGVWFDNNRQKWCVQVRAKVRYSIGRFDTLEEARAAHREASLRLQGEFSPYHQAVLENVA